MRSHPSLVCLLLVAGGCRVDVPTFTSTAPDAGDDDGIDANPVDASCGDLCDAYCLRGTVTVTNAFDTVNGSPSTMVFEHLEQNPTDYRLVFDVTNSFTTTGDGQTRPEGQLRVLDVTIRAFTFTDPFMNDTFGAAYAGIQYGNLTLVNGTTRGIYVGNLVSPTAQEYWGWEAFATMAPIVIAADGYPELQPTTGEGSGTNLYLRRYQMTSPILTDYAESTWTLEFLKGADCL